MAPSCPTSIFPNSRRKFFDPQGDRHHPGKLAVRIIEAPADGDHPLLIRAALDWRTDKGLTGWIVAMMNEIGTINAVRPGGNRPIGRHQPAALIIVDGDATELWHQRLLSVDQHTQALDLRRANTFGFQAFDESEQKQRALADNTFRVSSKRLGKVQAMDIHFLQCSISRAQYFPD